MASLSIRRLDDKTYERLRARAARHGVSMEEEARQILMRATAPPERLGGNVRDFVECGVKVVNPFEPV